MHNRSMQMQLAMAEREDYKGRDEHMRDGTVPGRRSHLPLLIIILMPLILESPEELANTDKAT